CPRPENVGLSSFGPRLTALIALLIGGYRLSRRKTVSLLRDVLGIRISLGAVSHCEERVSDALAFPVEEADAYVRKQTVRHADATGWRQARLRKNLWVLASTMVTVFQITADGAKATVGKLLGKGRTGVLISDRASVFLQWSLHRRQVCWAHLTRSFVAMSERGGPSEEVGSILLTETRRMFELWHRFRDGPLTRTQFIAQVAPTRRAILATLKTGATCSHPRTAGTCANTLKLWPALWTFTRIDGVVPTNNHAEQELRHGVVWRKLSFGTQSQRGDDFVVRIMTTLATLRKQARSALDFLTAACVASNAGNAPPSLLPRRAHTDAASVR
ncbi:MAG: IS66 family transposase, partial [Myxococcales bacterium]|nr:IS66 family transposase [Myxococcales bacterium]